MSLAAAPISLRVFLADDHPVVLAGVKALIGADPEMTIVGDACDGRSALSLATELKPDIVILDISMPGLNGTKVAELLRAACPQSKILALTVHEDRGYLRQLLELGVAGYVLKRSAAEELIRAIRAVAAGGIYLDPAIAGKVLGGIPQKATVVALSAIADLSERETEVLRLTAGGHSHKAVAAELRISVKSVETYKARAMEKLGFDSRVQLVRYAAGKGWLGES
ncbi:two component transcriptional regulator, LuxR family [Methylocella silvestris BL2]|uniref:Two component transcriptional regulator, LuxR family n=1 Tax=Methylocella silvestris (strain DSM 15510 / CIP 108128 / LMG 27833 / NCIMB 13906 / BL2) TaxID=395965 RepID=B8EPV5_METSB|nr:response regulator transcription factor [Methylocella silvestris]ACK50959.1 two component transcriptional regulator, LuxR family [Methylocella silvestris BL2]